ncbi:MAG: F0F1 ATP synthase subunit alpha [Firmicutes bacterium]|nr:F0F1 ATP synthase subunit alpha [Bacillota bacterium]
MSKKYVNYTFSELSEKIKAFDPAFRFDTAGVVTSSGDGIIKIKGLGTAKYGELLDVDGRGYAIALSLEEDETGAIALDNDNRIVSGLLVRPTGKTIDIPVGEGLLGRVVNPLGKPVDGLGELNTSGFRPLEFGAPEIIDRGPVNEPLYTGLLAIDSMIPIGKGQRELIIGDRQTGKTSIAIDAIINQRGKNVLCVYVAIGQKASTVNRVYRTLSSYGAMEYTTIICSTARDSAPLQYIAPFAGCAVAEEFMYSGRDVLIVYDDLTKHAYAYRAMSLLLKRPPGREAYPGDIFYLHSRLLERAAKLSKALGGGSMTALPIVETQGGDISAYIPTNVISITDGQIYLESELFNSGVRPAVNVGLSVSRVGGAAQIAAMRRVGGKLRLDLSQYRELAVFAQFGSDLDALSMQRLEQGKRTVEALKQDVHAPMAVEHQIIVLYITMKELLKRVESKDISDFNAGFIRYLDTNFPEVILNLKAGGEISMEISLKIEDAVNAYAEYFYQNKSCLN